MDSRAIELLLARDPDDGIAAFWRHSLALAMAAESAGLPCHAAWKVARVYALRRDDAGLAMMEEWVRTSPVTDRLHWKAMASARLVRATAERVLSHVEKHPCCDQRDLVFVLDRPPSEVRLVCREMESLGIIERTRVGGAMRLKTRKAP